MSIRKYITIRFTPEQAVEMEEKMNKYFYKNKSKFIKDCIFKKDIHYIAHDHNTEEITQKLADIILQYKRLGNNYNQVVRHLLRVWTEPQVKKLLEKQLIELRSIAGLTTEVKEYVEELKEII